MKKVSEVAKYLKANPRLNVGIDGASATVGADLWNQDLTDRRVGAIRDALIKA